MAKYILTGGLAGPWKKERYNQGGGSGLSPIMNVIFSNENGEYNTDMSIQEINNMNSSLQIVRARFVLNNGTINAELVYSDATTAVFSCVSLGATGTTKNVLYGQNDGTSDSWRFISE